MEKIGIGKNWYWQVTLTKKLVIGISQDICNSVHLYLLTSLMCASYKSFNVSFLLLAGFFSIYLFLLYFLKRNDTKGILGDVLRKAMFDLHLRKECIHSARAR